MHRHAGDQAGLDLGQLRGIYPGTTAQVLALRFGQGDARGSPLADALAVVFGQGGEDAQH